MSTPDNQDFTAQSGGDGDVAPLGRGTKKPEHERTAEEDRDTADWDAIAADHDFKALLKAKAKFIVPMTIFFIVYYFALPVLVGFFPGAMKAKVGPVNLAYLFALSQFFVAWAIAYAYTRVAGKWDDAAAAILAKFNRRK
jgi:uncharacterized membrane protein (DUF485 family)